MCYALPKMRYSALQSQKLQKILLIDNLQGMPLSLQLICPACLCTDSIYGVFVVFFRSYKVMDLFGYVTFINASMRCYDFNRLGSRHGSQIAGKAECFPSQVTAYIFEAAGAYLGRNLRRAPPWPWCRLHSIHDLETAHGGHYIIQCLMSIFWTKSAKRSDIAQFVRPRPRKYVSCHVQCVGCFS